MELICDIDRNLQEELWKLTSAYLGTTFESRFSLLKTQSNKITFDKIFFLLLYIS